MIYFDCTLIGCGFAAQVVGTDEQELARLVGHESEWYPDKYPCPLCGSTCVISVKCPENKSVASLTSQEVFAAFLGAGLPAEQECSATRVRELLLTHKVVGVTSRHISGTNRCTLERLELDNGLTLFLGSSTHGACVYRIQQRGGFTEAADETSTDNHPLLQALR